MEAKSDECRAIVLGDSHASSDNAHRLHSESLLVAPNSLHRVWVTPARRGKGSPKLSADQDEKTPAQPHVAMTWAQRLKRVFNIDVETCRVCGAAAKVCLH